MPKDLSVLRADMTAKIQKVKGFGGLVHDNFLF